jgi:uncharacterized protein YggE
MRMFSFVAPALGILLALGASATQAAADQSPATITVTGRAIMARPPDVAIITAEIVTHGPELQAAEKENDVIQDRVFNALSASHLSDNAGHTTDYQTVYVTPSKPANPTEHSGYVVTRTIQVELPPANLDAITHTMTESGVDTIDDVRTDVRNRDDVYHGLYRQALADAETQAHIIATAARVKITRVRSVDASTVTPSVPGMAVAEARLASIPVSNAIVTAGLTVTYEVEPFPLPGYMRKMPYPAGPNGTH